MKRSVWFAAGAVMAALGLPGNALAATCITRAEVAGMMRYSMPWLITAARDQCLPHLPNDAFVARDVEMMIASYRARQDASWPAARVAFMKFGTGGKDPDAEVLESMSDKALQPLVEAMIPEILAQKIKPENCRDVDTILASLAPLSPDQAGDLIAAIMAVSTPRQPSICTE